MFHFLAKFVRRHIARTSVRLYCLIYGLENEDDRTTRLLRYTGKFVLGMFLFFLMWSLVSLNFNLNRISPRAIVFYGFLILGGTAFLLNRNVRAMTVLVFVALVGRSGRTYLRAVAFAIIIAGPIANLARNADEVVRVFACTAVLTETRFELMAKPFTNTLEHMRSDVTEIRGTFQELEIILSDLKFGVEHADIMQEEDYDDHDETFLLFADYAVRNSTTPNAVISMKPNTNRTSKFEQTLPKAEEIQNRFVQNMRSRCIKQLNSGHRACEEIFDQGYRKCTTNFPDFIATVICWPYRVDIICKLNIFGNPDKICDASKVVPREFGQTYLKLLRSEHMLYENSSDVKIVYRIENGTARAKIRRVERMSREFNKEYKRKKRVFDDMMLIMEKILCLFILRVIFASIKYVIQYRSSVDFDNFYITDYFKHVDSRRVTRGKRSLLPLRNFEKRNYIDVDDMCARTAEESEAVFYHFLQLSLEGTTACLFLLLDHLVVNLLRIIRRRSLINYKQAGEHEVRFHINGTGLMARLLRTTMKNFNIHERVSTTLSNRECLPAPYRLPFSFYIKLLLLYLAIIILIYQSATFLRLRRVICSYIFYKREKQRIVYLYNRMLRERLTAFESLRTAAEGNVVSYKLRNYINVCLHLRLRYPNIFGWLGAFDFAKRKCLICGIPEGDHFLVICSNCEILYCNECSLHLHDICISCGNNMDSAALTKTTPSNDSSVELYTYRKQQ